MDRDILTFKMVYHLQVITFPPMRYVWNYSEAAECKSLVQNNTLRSVLTWVRSVTSMWFVYKQKHMVPDFVDNLNLYLIT